ncbi:hypothetical protein MHBO_000451 [Bonamia ostreae]|uniref:Uncharacterized protein n=1 Tax=Bonamia ostreae TaxID=126728 RepID=A0ABV2AFL3_9EUKA
MKIKNKTNLTNTIIFKNNIHNKINDHNFDFSRIIIEKVVDENSIKSDDFPDETSILIFDNKNREITPFKRYVLLQNKIKELRKKEYSKKSVNEQILKNHDTIILKLIEKKKLSRQRLLISKEKFKSNKRLKMIRKYKSLKFIQDKIQSLKNKQQKITDRKIHTKNAVSDIVNSVETNKKTVSSYQKQIADLSKKLDSHKNTLEEKLDAISDINDKRKSMSEYIDNCSIHSENRLNVKERKIDSIIQAMQFIAAQMQKLVNLSNYMRSSLDKSKEFANYFLEIFNKRKKQHNRLSCVEMTENAIAFVGSQQNNLTQIKKIGSEINRYLDDKLSNLGEEDPAKTDKAKFLRDSKKYENEIASLSKKKVEAEILIESETKINKKLIDQLNSENENEKENLKELERILKKTEKSLKMTSQANELV